MGTAVLTPGTAFAGPRVIAVGWNDGGICRFTDDMIRVPSGHTVHADNECRLLLEETARAASFTFAQPGVDRMPKSFVGETPVTAAPTGGAPGLGVGVGSLSRGTSDLGVEGAVDAAKNAQSWIATASMFYHDEHGRPMYNDILQFSFKRNPDGSMFGFSPRYAFCQTDPYHAGLIYGVEPYDPDVHECWASIKSATAGRFEFDTGGTYSTRWFGTFVRYDHRKIRAHYLTLKTGFSKEGSYCEPPPSLPQGWRWDCVIGESRP